MGVNKTGRNMVRDLVAAQVSYEAVGTDDTAFSDTDTALGSEVLRKTFETSTGSDNQTIYEMWISATEANGYTLEEVAILNASVDGSMLCRSVFTTSVDKDNTKELLIEYKIKYEDTTV